MFGFVYMIFYYIILYYIFGKAFNPNYLNSIVSKRLAMMFKSVLLMNY